MVDADIVSEVAWSLQGNSLHRMETLTASRPLKIRRLWLTIPSRHNHLERLELYDNPVDLFSSDGTSLDFQVKHSDWPLKISAYATGNDGLGRGDRGPIPLHLILESKDITFAPRVAQSWEVTLSAH